jgi:hypothetical protein
MSPDGRELRFSTFLGGQSSDECWAIVEDPDGFICLSGRTLSGNFPTTPNSFDPSYNGDADAFITALSPEGGALVASTYCGGINRDFGYSMAASDGHTLVLTGVTRSFNFPSTGASYNPRWQGDADAFVALVRFQSGVADVAEPADQATRSLPSPLRLYPNPLSLHQNLSGEIRFQLETPDQVVLELFDATGRRRASLAHQWLAAGEHRLRWEGRVDARAHLTPGRYCLRLRTPQTSHRAGLLLVP